MIKNIIIVMYRNMLKQKAYVLINVTGLIIALTCFLIAMMYVKHELSYEEFFKYSDTTYRIVNKSKKSGEVSALHQSKLSALLLSDYKEVKAVVRFANGWEEIISYEDNKYKEKEVAFADTNFFQIFDFKFCKGSPGQCLLEPSSIVLSSYAASKMFGSEDPMGKIIYVNNNLPFRVTAVIERFPSNTDMTFDYMVSIADMHQVVGTWIDEPWAAVLKTYIVIDNKANPDTFEKKMPAFLKKHFDISYSSDCLYTLQPLRKQHLYSNQIKYDYGVTGNIESVNIFIIVSIFLLGIACINYINLTTARASLRYKEIGIRRVFGSSNRQIIMLFMIESLVLMLISLIISTIIAGELFHNLSFFIAKKTFSVNLFDYKNILWLLLILTIVSVTSGGFVAIYMTKINTSLLLKRSPKMSFKSPFMRRMMIGIQYTITLIMIMGLCVTYMQYKYMVNKDIGYHLNGLISIDYQMNTEYNEYEVFKNEIIKDPNIFSVSACDYAPPYVSLSNLVPIDHSIKKDLVVALYNVDYDYVKTMGISILKGRDFSKEYITDDTQAVLINEAAAKELGWEDPIDKTIRINQEGKEICKIVGMIKDYHHSSLKEKIAPLVITLNKKYLGNILVKMNTNSYERSLQHIKSTWVKQFPDIPITYNYISEEYYKNYQEEETLFYLFAIYSSLAIIVCLIGVMGLSSYYTENRKKEIGIRKVLGASIYDIVIVLFKEFFNIIILSIIIACPIAYYLMNKWLTEFAYKVVITPWIFISAGIIIVATSFLIVGYHSSKAAIINPIKSLKSE